MKAFGARDGGRPVVALVRAGRVQTGLLPEHFGQQRGVTSRRGRLLLLLQLHERGRRRLGRVRQPFRVPLGRHVGRKLLLLLLLVAHEVGAVRRLLHDHLDLGQRRRGLRARGHGAGRPRLVVRFVVVRRRRLVLVLQQLVFVRAGGRASPAASDDPTAAVGPGRAVVHVVVRVDGAPDVRRRRPVVVRAIAVVRRAVRVSVRPVRRHRRLYHRRLAVGRVAAGQQRGHGHGADDRHGGPVAR